MVEMTGVPGCFGQHGADAADLRECSRCYAMVACITNTGGAMDKQVGGDHYRKHGEYQPWKVLEKWLTREEMRGFMKGTTIVYLARERDKNGDEDLAKAMHTLQGLLEMLGS